MTPRSSSADDLTPFATSVAEAIALLMDRGGISGAELGRRIGKSQNYIAKRLRYELAFTLADLDKIAGALSVAPTDLLRMARGLAEIANTDASVTDLPERGAWDPQQKAAAHEYDDVPDHGTPEPDAPLGDDEYA